jgi:uncharacterized membrane protein YkvA (DUF1232 family)
MLLWFCCRHRQTPILVKLIAAFEVAYALSPIDLIPDFIPGLGYLDDVILLPLGLLLVIKLMPQEVPAACRLQASEHECLQQPRPVNRIAALLIVCVWLVALAGIWQVMAR